MSKRAILSASGEVYLEDIGYLKGHLNPWLPIEIPIDKLKDCIFEYEVIAVQSNKAIVVLPDYFFVKLFWSIFIKDIP